MWKKWQLFHATDFQSLMYPCFAFCRILGIFPYRINALAFEASKRRYILTTIVICVLCIHELVTLYEIDISGTIKCTNIPETLERNCFYVLGVFIAIVTYILSGRRMHLLQTIMEISSKLSPDSYRKLSRLIHAKDIFGSLFLIGQATLYYSMMDFGNLQKILVLYILLVIFQMDMLHMNCVCVLKACFKEINDNLVNLRELIVNDESHRLEPIYHKHRNPFLLKEIKALKKQHLVVSDTVQALNMIFSLQLLASVVMTFAEITFQLYFYILHWKIGMLITNIEHELYDALLVTSMTYYCIKIALTGWACDTGKDQAMMIGITVHEIMNDAIDKQIKDELHLFSLQVLHRDNTFSAKGLIVDATLLVAIVTNITTYLLILIQFLVADQACFKRLNDNLANLQKVLVNNEPHFSRLIYYEQRNPFLLMKLKTLKKRHLTVSDTVQRLNIIFSSQLLATMIMTFIQLTFNIYYYVLHWTEGVLIHVMEEQLYHAYFVIVIMIFVTKTSLIVWACETGKNQASQIVTTIHDVLNCTNDRQIKDELQLFSLQILHRKNIFSAKGLTVDATLFAAIVSNVTTYILILIQFSKASNFCDEKTATNVTQSA
ncbi:PREDICTED: uncharacterized protein LOC105461102 [Wasmannia auropunctata]|uniref:uncharacterized protein LOC105461102 n=1 Tax=Wasmannia auropunctata TaxID=64793 RepID=UPI0005EE4602|nr:PREDICTED: uncharacterized protein LOC105461102 [Wasmannia auropunctata]